MALTFSTGMTLINDADTLTNWDSSRIAGSGQFAGASVDTTVFIEGGGSIGTKMAGNNWNTVCLFDYFTQNTAVLDMTATGSEVISMWVKMDTPGTALTQAAGGFYVLVSSSTETTGNPTAYSEWWVGGSDAGTEGWKLFIIDTRKTPSATVGGGATLSSVRRMGFGVRNVSSVGNVKADNVFVDAMWYGRPNYQVIGDGVLTATWADFVEHSTTLDPNFPNGLLEDIGGTVLCKCGFTFGDTTQTATTTFSDSTSTDILLSRETYHDNSTGIVDALNYSDYYNITGEEAGSFATSVTVGAFVGTGDGRQGVLGGSFSSQDLTNQSYAIDFSTVTTANLYGIDIVNAKDGVSLEGGQSVIGSQLINCGPLATGTTSNGVEVLNSFVIDPTSSDGTNIGVSIENLSSGGVLLTNLKNIGFITSGTPTTQRFVGFNEANDFSVDFNDLIYYGDFTSATLYHGQNAGTNSDITINSKGGSNVLASEFETLNGATVTVLATKTLTISGIEPGTELRIYTYTNIADPNTYTELVGAENIDTVPTSSTFDTVITDPNDSTKFAATKSYDSSGGDFGVVLVAHNLDFIFFRESFTLSSTENTSFTVFQIGDRNYDAGSVP